jgi:protein ImuB
MRTLCLAITDFWLAWARVHENAPIDRPVVLTVDGRVLACSIEASLAGVQPGLSERVLAARCPEAHVHQVREDGPRAAWQQLLSTLGKFSPLIEAPKEGLAYLATAGLERHHRSELHLGLAVGQTVRESLALPAGVGIAAGKFVAQAAALVAYPGYALVVPPGAERYFLQDLPASLLPLPEEAQRQLALLGIRTLAQYAALPHDALQARFGRLGQDSWRWAQGLDSRPLLRYPQERCLTSTVHLDDPVREQPALENAVERLLVSLCHDLQRQGLACQEMRLIVEMEKGPAMGQSFVLREPTADPARLQTVAMQLLTQLPCALQSLTLKLTRLAGLKPGRQLELFMNQQPAIELDSALVALAARYGGGCFQRARAVSPDSLLPERHFAFEQFRAVP